MGIGNTFATLPGVVSPIITGYIVQNKVSLLLWIYLHSFVYQVHILNCNKRWGIKNFAHELMLQSAAEWRIVFIIAGAVYLIGAVIYGIYASGEKQSWADEGEEGNKNSKKSYDNPAMEIDNL